MTDKEAFAYIKRYFHELFDERNLAAIDEYLHPEYRDGDIGEGEIDHRENSKRYLLDLFRRRPGVGVAVHKAMINNGVICADLEWYDGGEDGKRTWQKGIGIFVLKEGKIARRRTFLYFSRDPDEAYNFSSRGGNHD